MSVMMAEQGSPKKIIFFKKINPAIKLENVASNDFVQPGN